LSIRKPCCLITAIGGATEKDDIIAAVDAWFDTVGGGFETTGYLGNQENQSRKIEAQLDIKIDVRADSSELKEVLKGFAYAAAASEVSSTLSAAEGMSRLQAGLGEKEESVDIALSSNESQLSAFEIARSDLIRADPFETAIKLQEMQTQLETHFAVTARLSQLNLVDFLR